VALDNVWHFNVKGNAHRVDGPAVEWPDGHREWWVDGLRHRLDGPAVEYANGSCQWYVNGKRHRLDGPARKWARHYEWYVDDVSYAQWRGVPVVASDDCAFHFSLSFNFFLFSSREVEA
jgi:hypothetical protein